MSDKIMKSDLLIADLNKHLCDSGDLQQWMMSRSALQAMVNGNSNASSSAATTQVNMVAAMQDHISCTKSAAADMLNEFKNASGESEKVTLAYELDHMYANCGSTSSNHPSVVVNRDDSEQVRQLKDLLIKNLDIVEQQKQQLRTKDDQIDSLRKELTELKEKVEEQKRWSLQKSNNNNTSREKDSTSPDDQDDDVHSYARQRRNRGRRRFQLVAERRKKRLRSLGNESESSGDGQSAASCSPLSGAEGIGLNKGFGCRTSSKQNNNQNKDSDLQTDVIYYTKIGEVQVSPQNHVGDTAVLVPSWRIHLVSGSYQVEGTENLDDEVFLKRHQKLEMDEKRRKRWDIQRIREQRLQDKLKSGRSGNKEAKRNNSPELMTFYPQPEDAQYIEVSDKLPVTAFGIPIPHIEPCEFSLPWAIKCGKHLRNEESKHGT